jgi:C1A family cysteine protease
MLQAKFRRTAPDSDVPFGLFRKSIMRVIRHEIKYYTDRSPYLMVLNGRSADTPETKRRWNGFRHPPDSPSSYEPKLHRPTPTTTTTTISTTSTTTSRPLPPDFVDYRDDGLVTNVEDQGYYCACCYTFAAACSLEGQYIKKHKRVRYFSKQQVVDCSRDYGNFGCDVGEVLSFFCCWFGSMACGFVLTFGLFFKSWSHGSIIL